MKLGLRKRFEPVARRLCELVAWRWSSVLGRALLAGAGLVVLALIGRSALARNAPSTPDSTPAAAAATGPPAPEPVFAPDAGSISGPAAVGAPHAHATPDDPVVLNQATFEDLRRLPGIGPKKAQSILALRQRIGRFRQVEDLLKVKGIGRSILKKLRPLVRLDPLPQGTSADAATT